MPMQSKAQNAAMHAAAQGDSTLGIPKKVGQKFVGAQHGKPLGKLPLHKARSNKKTPSGKNSPFALKKAPPRTPSPAEEADEGEY